jgi:hypothetical protein
MLRTPGLQRLRTEILGRYLHSLVDDSLNDNPIGCHPIECHVMIENELPNAFSQVTPYRTYQWMFLQLLESDPDLTLISF